MPTLKWIGKKEIKNHHNNIEYRVLDCKETVGEENSGNLIVKGDNLLALKSLLPYYAGQVKMIYIDPPYNTGNTTWVYNDNVDAPIIKKWFEDNIDSNDLGRSDKWLCMMYPRLKVLHQFLKEDGAIFISIDDSEVGNLRLLLDDIFGRSNFVANIIWQKKYSPSNDATWFSDNHDHILVYAKNKSKWRPNQLPRTEAQNSRYKNPDNDERGPWKSSDLSVKTYSADYDYPIKTPSGRVVELPEGRCWMTSKKRMQELIDDNRIWFGKDGDNIPSLKRFLTDVKDGITPLTLWLRDEIGDNQEAKQELIKIMPENAFATPKPTRLLKKLLHIGTNKDDIIMDSFAGSGTTGQAVLEKNIEDSGSRKFILIEMEDYAQEITAERVKRVINGYPFKGKIKTPLIDPKKLTTANILNEKFMLKLQKDVSKIIESNQDNFTKIEKTFKDNVLSVNGINEYKEFREGTPGGFQYCELSEPLLDDFGLLSESVSFEMLSQHIYFTEFGIALNKSELQEDKYYAGSFDDKALYVFLDKRFTLNSLKTMLEDSHKSYIVYADATSISQEQLKSNNIIFKKIPFDIKGN